uniref:NPYR-5 n=1 Tax=Schmidtea mediterranea TaxID=79327 RepID=A0A193KUX4_SCHMD|nr:NPYR-5 [Schmidtea mediterranea]
MMEQFNQSCHIYFKNSNEIPVRSIEMMINYYKYCGQFTDIERETFIQVIKDSIPKPNKLEKLELAGLITILTIFILMIIFGVFGNALVVFAVMRYRQLQTARNVFILNLAISDLCLCIFTQPFNLLRLLVKYHPWTYGDVLCKMSALLQGTNVFVSTITITAIALDRFQVIIYPTRSAVQSLEAVLCLCSIWIISCIMASPLLLFSRVYKDHRDYYSCGEDDFRQKTNKLVYTIISIVFQYFVPILIVSIAYIRIYLRIKYRLINSAINTKQIKENKSKYESINSGKFSAKQKKEKQRQRRTNMLLANLSILFALSWLPLNIVNLYMAVKEHNFNFTISTGDKKSSFSIPSTNLSNNLYDTNSNDSYSNFIQAVCLMLVLASACINPILYGWLNDNFRKVLPKMLKCSSDSKTSKQTKMEMENKSVMSIIVNPNSAPITIQIPIVTPLICVEQSAIIANFD